MTMKRGYSWLEVRAVDDEKRIIEGIATTPDQARDGDIIETKGIQFKLPLPFLWRHSEPFGNVLTAKVGSDGISVRIQVAAAGVSESIDEYWRLVKSGTVRGLSIGYRILQEAFDKEINGFRIMKSEWLELSAVPVGADANALVTSVRSADEAILAALGRGNHASVERAKPKLPGVSGSSTKGVKMIKNVDDQIASRQAERDVVKTRMATIMDGADDEGRITDQADQVEYDGLCTKLTDVDKDLSRLRSLDDAIKGAKPVPAQPGEPERIVRPARVVDSFKEEREKLPPGTRMARAALALGRARGNPFEAAQIAKAAWPDTPEVALYLRAAVDAGDTTTSGWASQLVPAAQQLNAELIELLRAATIVGKIQGLRKVPFNVAVALQTGGGSYGWVGEGAAKPVTSLTVDSVTLRWAKIAGIIAITQELARFSSPSAEATVRNDMVEGTARYIDQQFVDPAVAEVTNVSPGSITNGVTATNTTATTADAFRIDMATLMGLFIANNQDPSKAVVLMSATQAMRLSAMINTLGQSEFPGIGLQGGTILGGLPVIVSETVGTRIILLNAGDILLADDGGVRIDVSTEATVEMSTSPTTGEQSPATGVVYASAFQRNLVLLRVERFITWKRARLTAVQYLQNVAYVPQ